MSRCAKCDTPLKRLYSRAKNGKGYTWITEPLFKCTTCDKLYKEGYVEITV